MTTETRAANNRTTKEFIGCAWCFEENIDMSETDEEGIFWTYCRKCDCWTEHPPLALIRKEGN